IRKRIDVRVRSWHAGWYLESRVRLEDSQVGVRNVVNHERPGSDRTVSPRRHVVSKGAVFLVVDESGGVPYDPRTGRFEPEVVHDGRAQGIRDDLVEQERRRRTGEVEGHFLGGIVHLNRPVHYAES